MRALSRRMRAAITVVLLAFVAVSVGFAIVTRVARPPRTGSSGSAEGSPAGDQTVVYYFHTTSRCSSCLRIEAWTKECLEGAYASDLAEGRLVWRPTNIDADGNQHFVKDFKLAAKTVVVCNYRNGRVADYADLIDVWTLLNDKEQFYQLVGAKVKEYLGRAL
jgi:hypothetical protein